MQQQASPLPKPMADPAHAQPMTIDGSAQDSLLSSSSYLTRHEVLTRRSRRLKQLSHIYTSHYWALMEDLKSKYRDYYWKYGKSPFRQDHKKSRDFGDSHPNLGLHDHEQGLNKCAVPVCKSKAMPLTKFCHPHILLDSKQKLYTACSFVLKSAQGRPVLCGKPILRSTVPALCPPHFQKAETYMARALKKAGLNVFSTTKLAPKFHVIVAEFVRQIQHRRRSAWKENAAKEVQTLDLCLATLSMYTIKFLRNPKELNQLLDMSPPTFENTLQGIQRPSGCKPRDFAGNRFW